MLDKKLFLIRHGESEGNVDESVYNERPDYAIRLTQKGVAQSRAAGQKLSFEKGNFTFFVSPYHRTIATSHFVGESLNGRIRRRVENPLLREREWGRGGDSFELMKEAVEYGYFDYKFKDGESCADVYLRARVFHQDLMEEMRWGDNENIVVVTHGGFMSVYLMLLLGLTREEFYDIPLPKNCETWGFKFDRFDTDKRFKPLFEVKNKNRRRSFPFEASVPF